MTDAPQQAPGFWRRLSRGTKIVIAVDLAVLVILLGVGGWYLAQSRSSTVASDASPTGATTSPPPSPLQTSYGLAWIVAACGGAMTLQDLPSSPLPRAEDYAVCLAPGSGASIAIGVYDDGAALDDDVADKRIRHRYATRVDDTGKHWLVLVEGDSSAPLQPLQRYDFRLR